MNPLIWQHQYNRFCPVTITNISYSVSSDDKTRSEKLHVKTQSSCFFEKRGDIHVLISSRTAKSFLLSEKVLSAECMKSGPYYAFVNITYQDGQKRAIYVETSKEEIISRFSTDDIGSFLVNFIQQHIYLRRTRSRIAKKTKLFGSSFPSVLKKIETVKKMKKLDKSIPEKMRLSDPEDELSSWIGTAKYHQKNIGRISDFLFS